uniref:RAP domain-containing protein n=1 Tax=Theileria annulata TaxID=5874 RepID=A0A3B0N995_THEAN
MNVIWNQFMYEICERVSKYNDSSKFDEINSSDRVDKFTPTDISLIFSSFSHVRRNNKQFYDFLLQSVLRDVSKYTVRDIAVLYNSLAKLSTFNEFVFDSLNKDVALLLNSLLDLRICNLKEIFVKCSLILSSIIKYIENPHTLTLLLYSYSRLVILKDKDKLNKPKNLSSPLEPKLTPIIANDYEHIILSDVIITLLSKCSDVLLTMNPTDLLYLYRSYLNLLFNSTYADETTESTTETISSNEQNVDGRIYNNILKFYKLNNQILQNKLAFQTRELIILYHLLQNTTKRMIDDNDLITFVTHEEMNNLKNVIKEELVYRTKQMSVIDSMNFINLLDHSDDSLELVFRRLCDKLSREHQWETYTLSQLLMVLEKIKARKCISEDSKNLVAVLISKTPRILKLSDLALISEVSTLFGIKSTALERRLSTIECRSENLTENQIYTFFHTFVSLGFLQFLDPILEHLYHVKDPNASADLLLDVSILKFLSLKNINEGIIEHLENNLKNVDLSYIKLLLTGSTTQNMDILGTHQLNYISNLKRISFNDAHEEFSVDFEEFVAKHDPNVRLGKNIVVNNINLPMAVEINNKHIAIVVLFDDFYRTNKKMLKLHKYVQLRLLKHLGVGYVCFDLIDYYTNENKPNLLANLLKNLYNEASGVEKVKEHSQPDSNDKVGINVIIEERNLKKMDNFSRFKLMVASC